jgi:hypothetical protein
MSHVFNNKNSNKIAIGIDFGTVNSSIAAFINDKVEILADSDGNKSIPSAVKFTGQEFQTVSKNDLASENTIHSKDFQVFKKGVFYPSVLQTLRDYWAENLMILLYKVFPLIIQLKLLGMATLQK